jgi:hypothetical protein
VVDGPYKGRLTDYFWVSTDEYGIEFIEGYEDPNNSGLWWCPRLGYTLKEGVSLFHTRAEAEQEQLRRAERDYNKAKEKLEKLKARQQPLKQMEQKQKPPFLKLEKGSIWVIIHLGKYTCIEITKLTSTHVYWKVCDNPLERALFSRPNIDVQELIITDSRPAFWGRNPILVGSADGIPPQPEEPHTIVLDLKDSLIKVEEAMNTYRSAVQDMLVSIRQHVLEKQPEATYATTN